MRIVDEIRYDSVPAAVTAMLADRDFVLTRCERMRSLRHTAQVTGTAAGAFTVRSLRTLATDRAPEIARRVVGSSVQIEQVDRWSAPRADGSRSAEVEVAVIGGPGRFRGRFDLTPAAGGTLQRMTGDLTVRVPLLGGQLEKLAEPLIRGALRTENAVGREWLGEATGRS